jgi:hypothetical protein
MKKIAFIILIGLTIFGCSSDNENSNTNLIGIWNWTGSSGGIAGINETPESTGNTIKLEIMTTSIKSYLNGNLTAETSYTIETKESLLFNEAREMIISENGFRQIINLDGNNLTLIGDCNDCFTSGYEKE